MPRACVMAGNIMAAERPSCRCDINAHHNLWGGSKTNKHGEELMKFISSMNLEILNIAYTPTFCNSQRV
nr:unnamed protein product [Callosobruchus chinensis]